MSGSQTKITQKGTDLYIQTQDKGLKTQYVESLVYVSGKVLISRKTYYTSILNTPDLRSKIRDIIRSQHEKILEEISSGQFDHLLTPKKRPEMSPTEREKGGRGYV